MVTMQSTGPHPSARAKGGPAVLGQMTDETVLGVLFDHGPSSRAAIAKRTGFSRPTMSESAQRLLAAGQIVEVGQTAGARGRSAVLYDLNPDHGQTLAMSIEHARVLATVRDYRGKLLWDRSVRVASGDLDDYLTAGRALVNEVRRAPSPLLAAAISVAAPVKPVGRGARSLPGAPISGDAEDLAGALGLVDVPVEVDNDVNWAAIAEHRRGSMRDIEDFLFVHLGAGVGAGLFLSGKLHRGAHGTAGEIAFLHMPDGETLMVRLGASDIGAADRYSVDVERAGTVLADAGSSVAQSVVEDLTRILVNVTTVLDPGHVVLGGPIAEIDTFADELGDRIETRSLSPVTVVRSTLAGSASLAGADAGARDIVRQLSRASTGL